jgi:uroporphyrinogen decarboxylase
MPARKPKEDRVFDRQTFLKTVNFDKPDRILMTFHINSSCWNNYPCEALWDLQESHPILFPNFKRPAELKVDHIPEAWKDKPFTDPWGCVWETTMDGITGSVHQHPLADLTNLESYRPPDPNKTDGRWPVDWQAVKQNLAQASNAGLLPEYAIPHGHTFLRLVDLRGYENLLFDMVDDDPRLHRLIDMIEQFNLGVVDNIIRSGAELVLYPEDLGMQTGPMLSPEHFRKFIKPSYKRIMEPARRKGCLIHMHSDGDIRLLADDLIEDGVKILNLQDLVNGIDWIAENLVGKVAIELDLDRQTVTPKGTPAQIDDLVRTEVQRLGSKEGGLMMIYGLYPGVPLANAKAVMDAMEKYSTYYSG